MEPHQQRVIEEKSQLDERNAKLETFIGSSTIFVSLTDGEQTLLTRQLKVAKELSKILGERIEMFAD